MFGRIGDVVLVLSALTVAALLLRRELRAGSQSKTVVATRSVENWQGFLTDGRVTGDPAAELKIVVFTDYQCPGCAHMHAQVRDLMRDLAPNLAVVHRNLPLPGHPHAMEAALAAECAADQERLESFTDVLFGDQENIGVTRWDDFAKRAHLLNLSQFERCMRDKQFLGRVEEDIAMARELKINVTPTYLVEGVLLLGPNRTALEEQIQKAIARRSIDQRRPPPSARP